MKSIFIFTSNFPYGRGEEFLMNEINALAEQGFEITLIPNFKRGEKQKGIHHKIKIENSLANSFSSILFLIQAFLFSKNTYSFIIKNLHEVNSVSLLVHWLEHRFASLPILSMKNKCCTFLILPMNMK